MASVIIPVLLCFFLGPGVGQLYNKEYKKGTLLMVGSLLVLVVAGVWYYKNLQPFLPADLTSVNPEALQPLLTNAASQLTAQKGSILAAFEALLTVLWLYGIVDAYRVAQRKRRME